MEGGTHQKDMIVSMDHNRYHISHNRWSVGVMSKRTYGNLWHIDGQWVSGQNVLMFLFFFAQLPLQELKFIGQFNFSLALPDIVANKTLGESALPGKFFYQSYVSKPFASTPCLGDLALLFFFFFSIVFRLCHHTGKVISSRDLPLSFTSVQWLMNVSKWYSCWKS